MNPIDLAFKLKAAYTSYLLTNFSLHSNYAVINDVLRSRYSQHGQLIKGPFLEATPPYCPSETSIQSLIDEGVLCKTFGTLLDATGSIPSMHIQGSEESIFGGTVNASVSTDEKERFPASRPLYIHQDEAIRRICGASLDAPQTANTVVSSGTGSGKTECFLIPAIDWVLRHPGKGIRVVLVYPMNALVNDQIRRLCSLIGFHKSKGEAENNITFARYTGETERTDLHKANRKEPNAPDNQLLTREQIWESPPDILITNFAMLEQSLLRPQESPFFDYVDEHAWRYIILDEAHSYRGAQAIDLAHLLKRVRAAVQRGKEMAGVEHHDPVCIATSATLTDSSSTKVAQRKVTAEFANDLFPTEFTPETVILAEKQEVDSHDGWEFPSIEIETKHNLNWASLEFSSLNLEGPVDDAAIARIAPLVPSNVMSEAVEVSTTVRELLYHTLKGHPLFRWLWSQIKETPQPFETLADNWCGDTPDSRFDGLAAFVECCNAARLEEGDQPLLPCRYHLFASALEGVYLQLVGEGESLDDAQIGSLHVKQIATRKISDDDRKSMELCYCTACNHPFLIHDPENDTAANIDELPTWQRRYEFYTFTDDCNYGPELQEQTVNVAITRDDEDRDPINCKLFRVESYQRGNASSSGDNDSGMDIQCCPNCGRNRRNFKSIIRRLSTGQDIPISILTDTLYNQLPAAKAGAPVSSSDKDPIIGGARKLLIFNDSRQNAALLAARIQQHSSKAVTRSAGFKTCFDSDPLGKTSMRYADWIAGAFQFLETHHLFSPYLKERELFGSSDDSLFKNSFETGNQLKQNLIASALLSDIVGNDPYGLEGIGLLNVTYETEQLSEFFERDGEVRLSFLKTPLTHRELGELCQRLFALMRRDGAVKTPPGVELDSMFTSKATVLCEYQPDRSRGNTDNLKGFIPTSGGVNAYTDLVERWLENRGEDVEKIESLEPLMKKLFQVFSMYADSFSHLDAENRVQLNADNLRITPAVELWQCDHCNRYTSILLDGVCSTRRCKGHLTKLSPDDLPLKNVKNNYFIEQITKKDTIDVRCEEHTAQLSSENAQETQEAFQQGQINILCCSTTFEMGIDIGSLQAIVLRNIPPSTANYIQRAGRAGRRADAVAFVLTYCQRTAHDQFYFNNPTEIIAGKVTPPKIDLQNTTIRNRHCLAEILAEYFKWLNEQQIDGSEGKFGGGGNAGLFFQASLNGEDVSPYGYLREWLDDPKSAHACIDRLESSFGLSSEDAAGQLARFTMEVTSSSDPLVRANDFYHSIHDGYQQSRNDEDLKAKEAEKEMDAASGHDERETKKGEINKLRKSVRVYDALLRQHYKKNLISFLVKNTALPSFTFPVNVTELHILAQERSENPRQFYNFDRDMKIALSEYAPGSEVVAGRKLYKPVGLHKFPSQEFDPENWYRWCRQCNGIEYERSSDGSGFEHDNCPYCASAYPQNHAVPQQFIEPTWGFVTCRNDKGSKVRSRPVRVSSTRSFFIDTQQQDQPIEDSEKQSWKPVYHDPEYLPSNDSDTSVEAVYSSGSRLLVLNLGENKPDQNDGFYRRGFRICNRCGLVKHNAREDSNHRYSRHRAPYSGKSGPYCNGEFRIGNSGRLDVALGHEYRTDVLSLRFTNTGKTIADSGFWYSLAYAISHAASIELNIERNDIDVTISPNESTDDYSIILFDAVAGGAGHAFQVLKSLENVLRSAKSLLDGCTCDATASGCYGCLADYRNQFTHSSLSRGKVLPFLNVLVDEIDTKGLSPWRRQSKNPSRQIKDAILKSNGSVKIYTSRVHPDPIVGSEQDWFDVIKQLGNRFSRDDSNRIELYVSEDASQDISTGNIQKIHFNQWIDKSGIKVFTVPNSSLTQSIAIIEKDDDTRVWKWDIEEGLAPSISEATECKVGKADDALASLELPESGNPFQADEIVRSGVLHFHVMPSGQELDPMTSSRLGTLLEFDKIYQFMVVDPFGLTSLGAIRPLVTCLRELHDSFTGNCEPVIITKKVQLDAYSHRRRYNFESFEEQKAGLEKSTATLPGLKCKVIGLEEMTIHDRLILVSGLRKDGSKRYVRVLLGHGLFCFSKFCRKSSHGIVLESTEQEFNEEWQRNMSL